MADLIRGAPTNNASQLSPPTLHWGTVGPDGDRCDVCRAIIKPAGDCFVSIRRAFEFQNDRHTRRIVEVEPITVVMCVDCGWSRPYAPTPHPMPAEASEGLDAPFPPTDGPSDDAPPSYFDAGVMESPPTI